MYLHGNYFRYQDFFNFLSDNHIDFSINSKNLNDFDINIIDIVYYCDIEKMPLAANCFIFCGSSYKILELESQNIKLDYNRFLTHNLYYAHLLNGIFLPMFLYHNDIVITPIEQKYKYGMFLSLYDSNYIIAFDVLRQCGIDYKDVLFLDREGLIPTTYNVTSDKNIFYSSIYTFLDIANDYNNRHVVSRTYLELIANNIPIHIISFNNHEAVTFKNFRHLKYQPVYETNTFKIYNVEYNKYYFNTQNYSNYISLLFNYYLCNNKKPSIKDSVEEYSNNGY